MTAVQLNLNKLILPKTNTVIYPTRRGSAGGEMRCDGMATPGWEFSLVFMNLLFSLGCLPNC